SPLTAPSECNDLYDPATVPLPVGYDQSHRPYHTELSNIARFFDYDAYFDEAKMREAIAAYFGLTSFMDHCVGRVLSALEAAGLAECTTVLYVSDHGEMLGDHGFWTKQVMYEASAGVPMILAGPSVPARKRVKTPASLIDIAPTATAVTGAHATSWPGNSLIKIAQQPDDPDRQAFSEYHDGGSTTGTFMVRWDRWKYIYYVGHAPQLFDLSKDPDELNDLWHFRQNTPVVQAALDEGERRLRSICDPEAVNEAAFSDQARRIAELGGKEACENAFVFNHTPTPN
ncbi:MAG: sulfatase-like hydrolase/transferase, partial [Boseongicola sp.]|nr:sulfatase-like hydrolase/transferase [Boseongicola sp.]